MANILDEMTQKQKELLTMNGECEALRIWAICEIEKEKQKLEATSRKAYQRMLDILDNLTDSDD